MEKDEQLHRQGQKKDRLGNCSSVIRVNKENSGSPLAAIFMESTLLLFLSVGFCLIAHFADQFF